MVAADGYARKRLFMDIVARKKDVQCKQITAREVFNRIVMLIILTS
jgi:hypothetical protein